MTIQTFPRRAALSLFLGLFLCATAAIASAQNLKIGVLDFKQVTERSTAIQSMIKAAEAPLAAKKSEIESKSTELHDQMDKLEQRRSVLSADQIKTQQQAIDKLTGDIKDMQYEVNKQYEKLDQEVMQPAVDRIMNIMQDIAKKEGYDLIIPSEVALFHADKIDLTSLVIQTLDKEGAKLPAPALPNGKGDPTSSSSDKSTDKSSSDKSSSAKSDAKSSPKSDPKSPAPKSGSGSSK